MADRYQSGPPADDDYDRGDQRAPNSKSDPLAELARLIGQTDPFTNFRRPGEAAPAHFEGDDDHEPALEIVDSPAARQPSWMQHVARQEIAEDHGLPSTVHPLKGYAANYPAPQDEQEAASLSDDEMAVDPSRYDDALYGQFGSDASAAAHDPAYPDDLYAYQENFGDEVDGQGLKKRRGGMITVAIVLLLAVVGTGGAFAYRTYVGSPRTGEPPVIKADTTPNKIVPASVDTPAKMPDRLAAGEGAEKIVPREEQPVDVNSTAGTRLVFPPLNQNPVPPGIVSATPGAKPAPVSPMAGAEEPRKIKTFAVRGDQSDIAATPAPKPAPRTTARPPTAAANANASASNAPLSLSPQSAPPASAGEPRRVAANNPAQIAPASGGGGGGYVVQISSQKNEADAQASYRALQNKFPTVLGSRAPLIKRADLGDKGVYYRAMIGPFASPEEAAQLCGNLKTAGGQCVVQRN